MRKTNDSLCEASNEHGVPWEVLYERAIEDKRALIKAYRDAFREIFRVAKKIDDAKLGAAVAAAKKALD